MATYRQVLNRVLKIVGEDEIDSAETEISDDYQILLGTFFNFIKEEVEDAINWRALWHTETITLSAAASSAAITNTTDRSRLIRIHDQRRGQLVPLVFDVTDANSAVPIQEVELAELLYRQTLDTQSSTNAPTLFAVDDTSASTLTLRFHPTPSVERSIKVTVCTPQAEFEEDDLDTSILVPSRAIMLGTTWWALQDKGEELGQGSLFSEERFRMALASEVARESEEQGGLKLVLV